jgi:DNA-binding LacI/PurR family transcriptional regulator
MKHIVKHTTITDVAKKLGISTSTVSRALSDHPDVDINTKKRVKKTAKELHYSPNPIAQSLRNNKTMTIGVIVPEIKHDFFSSAISGIEEIAYKSGYTIILCQSNESFEREVINTNLLMHQRVAGIVVSISQNTKCGDHFNDLLKRRMPLVFFDRVCDDVKTSKVIIDDYKGAFDAVTYLVNKGYKRIAHFCGPKDLGICMKRRSGYLDAIKYAQNPTQTEMIRYGGLHEQDGYNSMKSLLAANTIPDAIFAVNDPVAIGAYQKIKEAGLRIPHDVAIMGFSNNKITGLVDPQLTTVDQPSFEMGKKSAEILIGIIKDTVKDTKTMVLDTKLIIRGST